MKHTFLLILLVALGFTVTAQSKIEKAKSNMDSFTSPGAVVNSTGSYSDDDETGFFEDLASNVMVRVVGFSVNSALYMPLNLPLMYTNLGSQIVRYEEYPYKNGIAGIRNPEAQKYSLFQFEPGYLTGEDFFALQGQFKFHVTGWIVKSKFKYYEEQGAPYPMNYFNVRIGRKGRSLFWFDWNFNIGFDNLHIGDNYPGFGLGGEVELFPLKPLSIAYSIDAMFHKDKTVSDQSLELRTHYRNLYFGLGYNGFKVEGVPFDAVALKAGLYF